MMELDRLIKIAGKIKSKEEERNLYLEELQEKGLKKIYLICEECSKDCSFITKESERELYSKTLFDAYLWGIKVSNKNKL